MTLSTDILLDRIKLKSEIKRWRLLALLAVFVIATLFYNQAFDGAIGQSYIARIDVRGFIGNNRDRNRSLVRLAENDRVKAVILHINSPGGTVVGGETLHEAVKKLKKEKPVVVVMDNIATSAAYMVALAADYIVAHKSTITGSIGVLFETVEFTELAKKLGIQAQLIKSTPLKGTPSPFEKMTPEVKKAIQDNIDDNYAFFLEMLIENRNLSEERARALADGRIFSGTRALENKLIDAIGSESEAVTWLETEKNIESGLAIKDINLNNKAPAWKNILPANLGDWNLFNPTLSWGSLMSVWQPSATAH